MLSAYHAKYAARSDEDIAERARVKEMGLGDVLKKTGYRAAVSPQRVAILGCAERRFVAHHRQIFSRLLGTDVEITTFDITVAHLEGETGIMCHDISLPLPNGPYDVTYGDVVLKFLSEDQRMAALLNSFEALRQPGIAIHMLDTADGLPAAAWKEELNARGIRCEMFPIEIAGVLPVTVHETALVLMR